MQNHRVWLCFLASLACTSSIAGAPRQSSAPSRQEKTSAKTAATKAAQTEAADESPAAKLPVRRVILYKSGVGYFEHVGHVFGNQTMRVDFTSGQLNDVLQSLTVLDLNGGRIADVNYNSEAPIDQRLGTLRLPLDEKTDVSKFYAALRGARLEVRSGTTVVTGRLLSVERKTRVSGGTTLEVDLVTLVSDTGEVRSLEVTPAVSVRVAEHDVNQEVGRYLSLLSSERQQDLRRMTISTAGSGDRQLYVSYISEVPIWKTSYRIVLPSKPGAEPLLQGWAIVDNTVGEDWNGVELSLVAGAPQSFIEQLSQPYYARRPIVPLPESVQLTPQTHESALTRGYGSGALSGQVTDPSGAVVPNAQVKLFGASGEQISSTATDGAGNYVFHDIPAGTYRVEVESPGFRRVAVQGLNLAGGRSYTQAVTLQLGSSNETVEVTAAASLMQTENGDASVIGSRNVGRNTRLGSGAGLGNNGIAGVGLTNLESRGRASGGAWGTGGGYPQPGNVSTARDQMTAAASGADLGDLFEYKLKDRITIHKNESALVPIVQAHVGAEKVSLWNPSLGSARPLRALWLTNSSALTLDGGSFSVLEDEAFAGEGITDPIKPGEKRLLSYAADLGVRVEARTDSAPQRVTHLRIAKGVMFQTSELRENKVYTIRDDDTTPRIVLIEAPVRPGWTLAADSPKPEETTSAVYRFRLSLEPKATATLAVREMRPLQTSFQLTNLTTDQIAIFVQGGSISAEAAAEFRKIVEQKNRVSAIEADIAKREEEKAAIFDDQQRLRENLKALKGSAEERALTQRYTQQLANQETRLEAIERETAELQAKLAKEQETLDNMIQDLSLDTAL